MKIICFLAYLLTFNVHADEVKKVQLDGVAQKGYRLSLQNAEGEEIAAAAVWPERWSGSELTEFVARFEAGTKQVEYRSGAKEYLKVDELGNRVSNFESDEKEMIERSVGGRFVKGLKGRLEKWQSPSGRQTPVLVFRSEGRFVTWAFLDLQSGWNRDQKNGLWNYEVRYSSGNGALSGLLVNSISLEQQLEKREAFFDMPGYSCKILAIRDTNDGERNGQFLTVVYPKKIFRKDNKEACYYFAPQSPFLNQSEKEGGSNRILTYYLL